jgi:hypothetical protein
MPFRVWEFVEEIGTGLLLRFVRLLDAFTAVCLEVYTGIEKAVPVNSLRRASQGALIAAGLFAGMAHGHGPEDIQPRPVMERQIEPSAAVTTSGTIAHAPPPRVVVAQQSDHPMNYSGSSGGAYFFHPRV